MNWFLVIVVGKAVPKGIKSMADVLLKNFPNSFSNDFGKNNGFIDSVKLEIPKKTKNRISGFITRKFKKKKQKIYI